MLGVTFKKLKIFALKRNLTRLTQKFNVLEM